MNSIWDLLRHFIDRMLELFNIGRKTIKNTLNIYIKSQNGCTLSVNLEPEWDIRNVKEIVAPQLGLQPDEVKIIFAGKELSDNTTIRECDLGQQSVLHAIRTRSKARTAMHPLADILPEEETTNISQSSEGESPSKPLCETLTDLESSSVEDGSASSSIRRNTSTEESLSPVTPRRAQFFVYCGRCRKLCRGKLRVRCHTCQGGAITVLRDPKCWDDVLKRQRIRGHCETSVCIERANRLQPEDDLELPYVEFYFKCAEHVSEGEKDFAAPLNLIRSNLNNVPCLACTEVSDIVLVFPCHLKHVTCIPCFLQYCRSRLLERQFVSNPEVGYTLNCPAGCENSLIEEIHHFKLLNVDEYDRYQRFATEEYVLKEGGVLCPQPNCGMGLLVEENCLKVTCQNGCGYVFCRRCLQGYHLGDCEPEVYSNPALNSTGYRVDPNKAADARWDEASRITIRTHTKPCPQCRTPTERDGGCMHMVCSRSGCGLEWCWVCQTKWSSECMGTHWFG